MYSKVFIVTARLEAGTLKLKLQNANDQQIITSAKEIVSAGVYLPCFRLSVCFLVCL